MFRTQGLIPRTVEMQIPGPIQTYRPGICMQGLRISISDRLFSVLMQVVPRSRHNQTYFPICTMGIITGLLHDEWTSKKLIFSSKLISNFFCDLPQNTQCFCGFFFLQANAVTMPCCVPILGSGMRSLETFAMQCVKVLSL